uniref:Pentatricopeptide repeat-containing protein At2g26790 n=1 Tax=Rhizophora mucronata TaxID=61149 RepID=A0A2P2IYJ0_RHIMU
MWVSSSVKIICRRQFVKNVHIVRFYAVSALAQLNPTTTFTDSIPEELTVYTHKHNLISSCFAELDTVETVDTFKVVETLNRLRAEPRLAFDFFNQIKESGFHHDARTYAAIIRVLCFWGLDRKLDSVLLEVVGKGRNSDVEIARLFRALAESECSTVLVRVSDVLVKLYVNAGMFDEAIDVLCQVKYLGLIPHIFSCNYLMNRLIGCGKVDIAMAIYRHLKGFGVIPNKYTYAIAIKAFSVKGRLEEAFDVFREMEESGVTPSAFAYSTYIEGLCMHGRPDLGLEMLRALTTANVPIDVFAFTVLIRRFCNDMKLKEAESILLEMESLGFVPDEYIYGALICGFCRAGKLLKALVLHNAMTSKGMKTNCVIVSSILQGLVQIGMVSEAAIQFQEFTEMGIFLDQACYNIVMCALCKLGNMEEAAALLVDMKGKKIFPDVVNYTTLIRGYCLKGRLIDAVKLLEEMKENGLNPDVITYNILADGFSRNGHTHMVLNLLHYMEAQGLKPNTVTHNMIIEGFCIGGKVEDAEIFLDNLEDKCLENYSALVSGYCEANQTDEAFELFIRLSKQGHIIKENSCLKLLSNLCMEGDNHKALFLLETMLALEVNPYKIMYSKVIGALCRAGEMKKAQHIFDIMVSSGVIDLVTYTMMINGYCRVNCLREGYDLLQDMENRGIKPDVITYTVLLDSCLKQSSDSMKRKEKISKAFWREMKDMDIQVDVICYTVLIDSHCKANNIKEALSLFDDMIDRGIQPDTVTYTALLSGYCRVGDIDKAVLLFSEMLHKGILPDDHTFSTLRHGVLKARRVTLVAHRQQLNTMLSQLFKAK